MTPSPPAPGANAAQIESWNSRTGLRWAALQEQLDAVFAPVTALLMTAAAPTRGVRALDVGCGCGETVLVLDRRAAPAGSILAVDVSEPMLGVTQARVEAAGLQDRVRVLKADAAAHSFVAGAVDLVLSRFGVMFFDDPVAAFRNIRTAMAEGGRLAFTCWQPLAANPWFAIPVEAIRPLLGELPPVDPDAPGPFAFARPERVRTILDAAGLADVAIAPHTVPIRLAAPGGVADATDLVMQVGAAARLLAEADPAVPEPARHAIHHALTPFDGPDGVVLDGAIFVVTASAPATHGLRS